jgi:hypothetical protein
MVKAVAVRNLPLRDFVSMASILDRLLYLRKVMHSMESDLGLQELSQVERDIVYAAHDAADSDGCFDASAVLAHELTKDIPKTSYHRAFNVLLERNIFRPAAGFKTRRYIVRALD